MMGLTFLTGGARSGKSTLAVALGKRSSAPVCLIATAEARDDEMAVRIARHRASRPGDWSVIEEPIDLIAALGRVGAGATVIIDCLTLWVANLMEKGLGADGIRALALETAATAAGRDGATVVVTNEVGSGIVPSSALAREFRDVQGSVNAAWAEASTEAYLVVAGQALPLASSSSIELS